jgi:hypothetical protein
MGFKSKNHGFGIRFQRRKEKIHGRDRTQNLHATEGRFAVNRCRQSTFGISKYAREKFEKMPVKLILRFPNYFLSMHSVQECMASWHQERLQARQTPAQVSE